MKFCKEDIEELILLGKRNIYLEGNILKLIEDTDEYPEFTEYIKTAKEKDQNSRKKRLEITKQIQKQNADLILKTNENETLMSELKDSLNDAEEDKKVIDQQNKELLLWKEENEKIKGELVDALHIAEVARTNAENDLTILQNKTQFELMGKIVKTALFIIIGIGITVTLIFCLSLFAGKDTQFSQQASTIGTTWTNIIGILLTNCFSIVGTIMGIKHATDKKQ